MTFEEAERETQQRLQVVFFDQTGIYKLKKDHEVIQESLVFMKECLHERIEKQ